MKVHSHIQVPKLILKSFCDENDKQKRIWYLDIVSGEIKQESKKILGTSMGFYSRDIEGFWNDTIEDDFGKLTMRIKNFCTEGIGKLFISAEDDLTIKKYFKSAAVRSKLANKSFKETCNYSQLASQQELNDSLSIIGMNQVDVYDKIIENYDVTILCNKADKSLAVPRNCYYVYGNNLIAPLSPNCAIVLSQNKKIRNEVIVIEESDGITQLNVAALKYELLFNEDFIATNNRKDLEELKDVLEKSRSLQKIK